MDLPLPRPPPPLLPLKPAYAIGLCVTNSHMPYMYVLYRYWYKTHPLGMDECALLRVRTTTCGGTVDIWGGGKDPLDLLKYNTVVYTVCAMSHF